MSLPQPSERLWSDDAWNRAAKVCATCRASGGAGARVTFASGETVWMCKACATTRLCARCEQLVLKGATVSFADGSSALYCKPCAKAISQPQATVVPLKNNPKAKSARTAPAKKMTREKPGKISSARTVPAIKVNGDKKKSGPIPQLKTTKSRVSTGEKKCEICGKRGGSGARVILASGEQEWLCKPCALRPRTAMVDQALAEALAPPKARRSKSKSPAKQRAATQIQFKRTDVPPPAPVRLPSPQPGDSRRVSTQYASMQDFEAMGAPPGLQRVSAEKNLAPNDVYVDQKTTRGRAATDLPSAPNPPRSEYQGASNLRPPTNYNSAVLIEREKFAAAFGECVIAEAELVRGEQCGEGSAGTVFRGEWRGVAVAIKELRDDAIEQAGESFRDEALRMRALPQHDNVCRFLGVAVKPFAIVTRFCALGALERIVYKRQRAGAAFRLDLTPEFVQRTLLGVARGLRHLHQHGIIHRDIATRNVLLDRSSANAPIDAMLSDFGMARDDSSGAGAYTKSRFGPIKWMAPEQIERQKYSKASDVYAFGVLIGELFERSPPMLGLDAIDAAHAIVDNARIPLHPPPPPGTQQLISWCWQMEPDGRPRMHDIIAALKKLPLEDFRVPEEPPSKAERKERGERNKEANKARIAREDAELAAKQHAAQSNVPKPARAVPQIQLPDEAETNEETGRSGSGRRSPRQRLGAWLRGLAHEPQHDVDQAMPESHSPRPDASEPNPLFGCSLRDMLANDGADAHGVPLIVAQAIAMLWAHRAPSTQELSKLRASAQLDVDKPQRPVPVSPRSQLVDSDGINRPRRSLPVAKTSDDDPINATRVAHVEGIFRLSGSTAQIQRVRTTAQVESAAAARQSLVLCSDAHTIAGVLKLWLREMPDKLLAPDAVEALAAVLASAPDDDERLAAALRKAVLEHIGNVQRAILAQLCALLRDVARHHRLTKMTPQTLGVVFAPSVTACSIFETKKAIDVICPLIRLAPKIFDIPAEMEDEVDRQQYAMLPSQDTLERNTRIDDHQKLVEEDERRIDERFVKPKRGALIDSSGQEMYANLPASSRKGDGATLRYTHLSPGEKLMNYAPIATTKDKINDKIVPV